MFYKSCEILDNFEIFGGYFLLKISVPDFEYDVLPGQFLKIRVSDQTDILFKRPFAIFDFEKKVFFVLYHIVGKGTNRLTYYKKGDFLNVLYPLGNGYPCENIDLFDNVVIVAGGIGFASVYYLIKRVSKNVKKNIFVILGYKTKKDIFSLQFISILKKLNPNILFFISTDDGTFGKKGNVVTVFDEISKNLNNILVFACGSNKMLESLSKLVVSINKNIQCYASFETIMGCGIGVCNGCTIKIKQDESYVFTKVCKDGPIFNIRDILWK